MQRTQIAILTAGVADRVSTQPDRARGSDDLEDIEIRRVVTGTAVDPDFTGDGQLDCRDLNLLGAEAGTNSFEFDLDRDGAVSVVDRVIWLQAAANANLPPGQGYLGGDFNSNEQKGASK